MAQRIEPPAPQRLLDDVHVERIGDPGVIRQAEVVDPHHHLVAPTSHGQVERSFVRIVEPSPIDGPGNGPGRLREVRRLLRRQAELAAARTDDADDDRPVTRRVLDVQGRQDLLVRSRLRHGG